jgi:hypothetical protein
MRILSSRKFLLFSIGITVVLFLLDFALYGSGISGDTPEYLSLAGDVYNLKFPHSPLYLPGFPVLVGFTAKLISVKIFQAAMIWMGLFYLINLLFLYKITDYFYKLNKISKEDSYFLLFIMISWWSFRIQKATHADAMYFCLLILLTYYTVKSFVESKTKNFLVVGFVLASMVITKYNSYVLVSIFGILLFLSDYDYKKRLTYFSLSILPPVTMIFLWKILNGGFIYALNTNNYENKNFDVLDVFISLYRNISDYGKTLVEIVINPIVGRYINDIVGLLIGLSTLVFLIYLGYKQRKNKLQFVFIIFAFVYAVSLIFIQSMNLVSEINIRTLITFSFFAFLLIGLYFLSHKNKLFRTALFFILLSNNFLIAGKWLSETSKRNSFKYEYVTKNDVVFQNKLFLKSIEDKAVMSNVSEQMMFHINYQKHVATFKTDRIFYKGKFEKLKADDVEKIANDLKICIENEGVVVFSNSDSSNDKLILGDLSTNKYCFHTINNLIIISKSKLHL